MSSYTKLKDLISCGTYPVTVHHALLFASFQIDVDTFERDGKEAKLDKIRKDRGYTYEDKVVIDDNFPDYTNVVSVESFTEIIE